MSTRKDFAGKRWGAVVALEPIEYVKKNGAWKWRFACDCGDTFTEFPGRVQNEAQPMCSKCYKRALANGICAKNAYAGGTSKIKKLKANSNKTTGLPKNIYKQEIKPPRSTREYYFGRISSKGIRYTSPMFRTIDEAKQWVEVNKAKILTSRERGGGIAK